MSKPIRYKFSFEEHDWLDTVDDPEAELLRRASTATWHPIAGDTDTWGEPEAKSFEDFAAEIADVMAEEMGQSQVGQALIARLMAWLAEQRLVFVGGDIVGFEGHHNDTEVVVGVCPASECSGDERA